MIMKLLQRETLDLHREVEALMPVMNESLSEREYARLLRRLLPLVTALEEQLSASALPAELTWNERRKAHLLAQDLAALGEGPGEGVPVAPAPEIGSVAGAFGALYVLEGSTLGGQLISRHLRRTLGLSPERGSAYFSGYGPQTGPRWRSFGAVLEASVPPSDAPEVLAGARQTFEVFRAALTGLPGAERSGESGQAAAVT